MVALAGSKCEENKSLEETLTAQVARLERKKTVAIRQIEEERKRTNVEKCTNLTLRCDKA